jgi:hypothetical protein
MDTNLEIMKAGSSPRRRGGAEGDGLKKSCLFGGPFPSRSRTNPHVARDKSGCSDQTLSPVLISDGSSHRSGPEKRTWPRRTSKVVPPFGVLLWNHAIPTFQTLPSHHLSQNQIAVERQVGGRFRPIRKNVTAGSCLFGKCLYRPNAVQSMARGKRGTCREDSGQRKSENREMPHKQRLQRRQTFLPRSMRLSCPTRKRRVQTGKRQLLRISRQCAGETSGQKPEQWNWSAVSPFGLIMGIVLSRASGQLS